MKRTRIMSAAFSASLGGIGPAALALLLVLSGPATAALWDSGFDWQGVPAGVSLQSLSEVYPSNYEQYLVELINRARADPLAEVIRTGLSDLNEGLTPGTISSDPKPPLAINLMLTDAARQHSQWMIDNDTFSHDEPAPRESPGDRMAAAGYSFEPAWGWGENIALYMQYPTAPDTATAVAALHDGLFVDEDYDGRGHRLNLMEPSFKEIGAGVATGLFYDAPYDWQSVDCTEDFATSAYLEGDSFITGVVYDDRQVLEDDFYTPGEGLEGIIVQAIRQSDQALFWTVTWPSGGYALRVPPGTYEVDAQFACPLGALPQGAYLVVVTTDNVKCDFQAPVCTWFEFTASLDHSWVYQNTASATLDRHKAVLTVEITTGSTEQTYSVTLEQDGHAVTDFQTPAGPASVAPGAPLAMDILGGRLGGSTVGSHTLTVMVAGSAAPDWVQTQDVDLTLRVLGDVNGDGVVNAADKLEINKKLNGVDPLPGIGLRELDLTGDGTTVNAEDKLIVNLLLNGSDVP